MRMPVCPCCFGRVLTQLAGALDIKLSEEEIKYLEEPYKPMEGTGHT